MNKRFFCMLALSICCAGAFSGCRRTPIETETETESETKDTETETETAKITETETETQSETQKSTTKMTITITPTTTASSTAQTTQTETTAQTETTTATTEASSKQCPYCGYWYYTTLYSDGTSDYSNHIAAEEAAANSGGDYDSSQYQTGTDGSTYGQCPYCYQWFSTVTDSSGYSPYSEHVAAESAWAAQQEQESYVQCPYCGNWVTQSDYQDHINGGY